MAEPTTSTTQNKRDWSADLYNQNAHFVYSKQFTSPVLDLLNPQPGDRILDMGCGSGELTFGLANVVGQDGLVVGMDASEDMIRKAKLLGIKHAFVVDIQTPQVSEVLKTFEGTGGFNKVFTNATLHWCKSSPVSVIRSAYTLLKSGGEGGIFVGEMGGFMNCIGVRSAMHQVLRQRHNLTEQQIQQVDPWWFPNVHELQDLLIQEGFKVDHISLNPRITPLPTGLKGWLDTFGRHAMLGQFDDVEAEKIIEEVVKICEVDMKDNRGDWAMMYMRLRWKAYVV